VFNFGVGLGLSVIAEGVETEECLRELHDLGCELAQGYLFGQPLSPLAMRRLLEHNVAVPSAPMAFAAVPAAAAPGAR
jgi:EAL domain-containing protein (putative c-di-GMP-specific phosphodiesterase class I)